MKRQFIHRQDNPRRDGVVKLAIEWIQSLAEAGEDFEIHVREPRRTLDANACMWATLTDIAQQVSWPHTDGGEWRIDLMPKDSWKAVLTAAYEQETRQAQGIGGGTVMLGARTSQYSRRRMGEFIEFAHAFGSERGVQWSAKAEDELEQFGPGRRAA